MQKVLLNQASRLIAWAEDTEDVGCLTAYEQQKNVTPLTLIAAVGSDGLIGNGQKLPWHEPLDLFYLQKRALQRTCIVGRKTAQAMPPSIGGHRVVLSQSGSVEERAKPRTKQSTAPNFQEALRLAYLYDTRPLVCGGASVYQEALPFATFFYLTEILGEGHQGDCFFPPWERDEWALVSSLELEGKGNTLRFLALQRVKEPRCVTLS